nr:MAG TPA: hypothetical protein [Microviridae sp.]
MKIYKQFKDFISQRKYLGVFWSAIRQDAINEGFNKYLFDFYMRVKQFRMRFIFAKLKKVMKYIFYIFVYIGVISIAFNVHYLVKSATIRNETETLALVVDTCRKAPKLCEYAVITGNLKLTSTKKEQQK